MGRTDHNSLTWLMSFKYTEGQLARWLEVVSQFNLNILHRSGKLHSNVDGLSRMRSNTDSCHYYETGQDLDKLPCGGCKHCIKLHSSWDRFESHIDELRAKFKIVQDRNLPVLSTIRINIFFHLMFS